MNHKNRPLKVVVFDLDETLGNFVQAGIFWDGLTEYIKLQNTRQSHQTMFNEMMDLFPEFLRPHILNILDYLKHQKQKKHCDGVYIFTNNQGPPSWAEMIRHYLEHKINYKLFDKVIGAYEVDGIIREKCRTSHEKSYRDFLRCANIHVPTQVCFIDDLLHHSMMNPNVYYIKITPYVFHLPYMLMIERVRNSAYFKSIIAHPVLFQNFMFGSMKKFHFRYVKKTKEGYDIDGIVTKRTMQYIEEFITTWKGNPT